MGTRTQFDLARERVEREGGDVDTEATVACFNSAL
jgi:hypothetical protein